MGGGKGGGGGSPSQVVQTDLPAYAEPYFKDILNRGTIESKRAYQPYQASRIAGLNQDILGSRGLIRQIAATGTPETDYATQYTKALMSDAAALGGQSPYQFSGSSFQQTGALPYYGFQAANVSPYYGFRASQFDDQSGLYRAADAGQFGGFEAGVAAPYASFQAGQAQTYDDFLAGQAKAYEDFKRSEFEAGKATAGELSDVERATAQGLESYMDPYNQLVTEQLKKGIREEAQKAAAARGAQAVSSGAFGGSRQAIMEGIAQNELLDRLAQIEAEQGSKAFQEARAAFQADRAAQMDVESQRLAEQARVQGLNIGEQSRVQQAVAAENARIQEAQAAELARVQGIDIEEARRIQQAQAAEQARVQGIDIEENRRIQEAQAAELARTQGINIEEARRVQQDRAAEFARTQGININEAARVQQAIAEEKARIQSANASEFARIQQSQAAELARVQGISVEEAARVQQAQAAELARVQGISVEEAARVQAGYAAERARVQEAQAAENLRQREFQRSMMEFGATQAQQLANLEGAARSGDIQAAQLLEGIGAAQRADRQAELDMAYQDFLEQRGYGQQQLNFLNSLMRGVPISPQTTTFTPYNPIQQALGAGISGLALYRGLQG